MTTSSLDFFANSARCRRLEENVFVMVRRDQHREHGGHSEVRAFPLDGERLDRVLSSNTDHPFRCPSPQGAELNRRARIIGGDVATP
jgi:hypothetical protein